MIIMEQQLSIIVKFEVKKDKIEYFKSELIKILEPTRKEPGCIQYDLHQDIEDPSVFMFYEIWETTDFWKAHDSMPHIKAIKKVIENSVDKISFNKLKLL